MPFSAPMVTRQSTVSAVSPLFTIMETELLAKWNHRLKDVKSKSLLAQTTSTKRTDQDELDDLFDQYLEAVKKQGVPSVSVQPPQAPIVIKLSAHIPNPVGISSRFADLLNRVDDTIWAEASEFVCSDETYVRITAANRPRIVETFVTHEIPWRSDVPYAFFCNKGFLAAVELPKGCGEFTLKYDDEIIATSIGGVANLQPGQELTKRGEDLADRHIGALHGKVEDCKYTGLNSIHLGLLGARFANQFTLHLHSAPLFAVENEKTIMLLRVLSVTPQQFSASRTVCLP